jgi:MFS superfamily sulfate permease-like transporter
MNIKAKITLIIIFTLIIGIVMGAMLNRALLHRRIARAFSWREPATIVTNLEKTLHPDAEQAQQIRKILEEHAGAFNRIRSDSQQEMTEAQQALIDALDSVLTPQQKRRLQKGPMGPQRFSRRGRDLRREGRPRSRWGHQLDPLREQLGLSAEQIAQIEDILREQRPANQLSQRDSQAVEQMIRRWKAQQRILDQAFSEVLTEEQKQEYDRLKEERQARIRDLLLR